MMFLKTCWLTEENFERSSKYTEVFLQILTIETYPIMQLKEVYQVFNYLLFGRLHLVFAYSQIV